MKSLILSAIIIFGTANSHAASSALLGRGGVFKTQKFEAMIRTDGLELTKVTSILDCSKFQLKADVEVSEQKQLEVNSLRTYRLSIPEMKKVANFSEAMPDVACAMKLELTALNPVNGKSILGIYDVDTFNSMILNDSIKKLKDEAKGLYPGAQMLEASQIERASELQAGISRVCQQKVFSNVARIVTKFESCEATTSLKNPYVDYYPEAQKRLGALVVKPNLTGDGLIYSFTSELPKSLLLNFRTLKSDFEVYAQKIRRGDVTETFYETQVENGPHAGIPLGALFGAITIGTPLGSLAGAALGEAITNHSKVTVLTKQRMLGIPHFDQGAIALNAWTVLAPPSDYQTGIQLLTAYQASLLNRKALSDSEVAQLQVIKRMYAPKLNDIIDLMITTDYANLGICADLQNCQLKK